MRTSTLITIILLAALTRLLPHPFNFTAITAIGLFGAAYFGKEKHWAFIIPIAAMLISDVCLELMTGFGFYKEMWVTYLGFIVVIAYGFIVLKKVNFQNIILGSLGGSILFFLITNFALFYPEIPQPNSPNYPHTLSGIIASYTAGLPFFRNTVLGDLFYSGVLFGLFALVKKYYKPLQTA